MLKRAKKSDVVYISLGCDVKPKGSLAKLRTQQFPDFLKIHSIKNPKEKITIILIDWVWSKKEPRIMKVMKGEYTTKSKNSFTLYNFDNVTFRSMEMHCDKKCEEMFINYIRENPKQKLIFGEYFVNNEPFSEMTDLKKAVVSAKNARYVNSDKDETQVVPKFR